MTQDRPTITPSLKIGQNRPTITRSLKKKPKQPKTAQNSPTITSHDRSQSPNDHMIVHNRPAITSDHAIAEIGQRSQDRRKSTNDHTAVVKAQHTHIKTAAHSTQGQKGRLTTSIAPHIYPTLNDRHLSRKYTIYTSWGCKNRPTITRSLKNSPNLAKHRPK